MTSYFGGDVVRFTQFLKEVHSIVKAPVKRQFYFLEEMIPKMEGYDQARVEFNNKLNRVFNSCFVQELLDKSPEMVTFKIMNVFEQLNHRLVGFFMYHGHEHYRIMLQDQVVKAMLAEKLLFMFFMCSFSRFSDSFYADFSKEFLQTEMAKLGFFGRLRYRLWEKRHGFRFNRMLFNQRHTRKPQIYMEPMMAIDTEGNPLSKGGFFDFKDYVVGFGSKAFRRYTQSFLDARIFKWRAPKSKEPKDKIK